MRTTSHSLSPLALLTSVCASLLTWQVVEWWEVLLEPWRHYVPISSTLGNLSEGVRWVRRNQQRARGIAEEAARLVESLLAPATLVLYTEALFLHYADIYRLAFAGKTTSPTDTASGQTALNADVEGNHGQRALRFSCVSPPSPSGKHQPPERVDCSFTEVAI